MVDLYSFMDRSFYGVASKHKGDLFTERQSQLSSN